MRSPVQRGRDADKGKPPRAARRPSAEGFRRLVEGVKEYAIFLLDPEGRVRSWNAGAEFINGYPADEVIGQHFSCFYPAEAVAEGAAR
jgi:PAS domain S-box-containing protein